MNLRDARINLKFYHLSLFTGDKFSTRIDMDILITLLDHGYDDLEGI